MSDCGSSLWHGFLARVCGIHRQDARATVIGQLYAEGQIAASSAVNAAAIGDRDDGRRARR